MQTAHVTEAARGWRSLLCIAASLAAILLTAGAVGTASADCRTGGSTCLPGPGYRGADVNWNCTIGPGTDCWYAGGATDTWGWGSAAFNAGGSATVCVHAGSAFSGCGTNIARACYYGSDCADQSVVALPIRVTTTTAGSRVVWGHAKS